MHSAKAIRMFFVLNLFCYVYSFVALEGKNVTKSLSTVSNVILVKE